MVATLNVNTLRAASVANTTGGNSVDQDILYSGTSKAWCYFTTVTTTAINGSFGVSSLTDNGTGSTDINLSNNLDDINSTAVGSAHYTSVVWCMSPLTQYSTIAAIRSGSANNTFNNTDADINNCVGYGTLA
jgi:hypothetical protein